MQKASHRKYLDIVVKMKRGELVTDDEFALVKAYTARINRAKKSNYDNSAYKFPGIS